MGKRVAGSALVLLSGGLDSVLASAILKRLGNLRLLALHCTTGFEIGYVKSTLFDVPRPTHAKDAAERLAIPFREVDVREGYLDMLFHPKHGYGSAVNPCLDCHIHMIRHVKRIMDNEGYDFIATGEVIGQRPMSQKLRDLPIVDKETGLQGRILRPLSGKLLPPTIAEEKGMVLRDDLYDIEGRSRYKQMELARTFGIDEYPTPAGGGCYIVDKSYAKRFRDYTAHKAEQEITMEDLTLLTIGRHFRIADNAKFTIGRDEKENIALARFKEGRIHIAPEYRKGPEGILELADGINKQERMARIKEAGKVIAWYSKEETEEYFMRVYDKDEELSLVIFEDEREEGKAYANIN